MTEYQIAAVVFYAIVVASMTGIVVGIFSHILRKFLQQ